MYVRNDVKVLLFCLLALTWGCASRTTPGGEPSLPPPPLPPAAPPPIVDPPSPLPVPPGFEPPRADCALIPEPGLPIATVAVSEPVNPANAPWPSNDSERLVFRQLYETLVRADCEGRVVPGLASSWRLSVDGRTWIVTLRPDARFSDGTAVTSAEVLALWSRDGVGGDLEPHVNRLVQSIIAVDGGTLAILLRSPRADAPLALAHTDLALAKPVGASIWPAGTRAAQATSDRTATTIVTASGTSIRFRTARGDLRDLLDESVDLLVTRDRAALEYAATLPQFESVPLAWQRTEVLLSPGRSRGSPSFLPDDSSQALATDAVRGEARGATAPFWWHGVDRCETPSPPVQEPASRLSGRVVYDASDSAARDLAERLVGLASASASGSGILAALLPDRPRRSFQRAAGLTGESLAQARRRGGDAAYVMSLEKHQIDPCLGLQGVKERAPWLDPRTIVPLVDTRLRAIVRRGHSGIITEWDGGLIIAGGEGQR